MIENQEHSVPGFVGHLFRHEAGKMAAVLSRRLGTMALDDIEDIVQDTLLRAMETWKIKGVPDNPTAWLHKVAWHRAIDFTRNKKREQKVVDDLNRERLLTTPESVNEKEIQDSVLRLMFVCCHPSIPLESQIAFTLKMLGGLSVKEIAKAFITSDETIAKRIYRAKEKIKEEKIELDALSVYDIPARLDVVLKVIYLLFNEGYYSSNPEQVIREDLCEEAIRLANLLVQNRYTNQPSVKALLSLMCFHASRFQARVDNQHNMILLEYQDRSKWNKNLMAMGFQFLSESIETNLLSEYHVEASIASVHAVASEFGSTNWKELAHLYEILEQIKPGKMVSFNKAIAIGYANSPQAGINALQELKGLESNQYYFTAIGNFHFLMNDRSEAIKSFERAKSLTQSRAEIELLNKKLKMCEKAT